MFRTPAIVLAAIFFLAGCGRPKNFANENDVLRARIVDLERQLAELRSRNAELTAELRAAAAAPGSLPEEIRANTPLVTSIEISRLSHAVDADKDGRPESLNIYVESLDSLARFTQIVGRLSVNAAILPGNADAITIGRVALDPAAVRAAYRSGLGGTHYTVTVPISLPPGRENAACVVAVTLEDGLTGLTHTASREIALRR